MLVREGEGAFTEETGDGEEVLEGMKIGEEDMVMAAVTGEGDLEAEAGGVRVLVGGGVEKLNSRS